jgi:hypothetical protein
MHLPALRTWFLASKMTCVLVQKPGIERPSDHPSRLMAKPFNLSKSSVARRAIIAKTLLPQQCHQFVELLPRSR